LSAQDTLNLTLGDAQLHALEQNRTLKNATLDVRVAEASRWQTLATMLPQVSATFDYYDKFDYEMELGTYIISMPNSLTSALTASVALSGAQVVGVQLKDIAKKMSNITLRQTEKEVTDQVKKLYYSALVLNETIGLLEKNLSNLEKLLFYTNQSINVGVMVQTDADLISVRIASMKTSISANKRSLEMIYNSLRLQLGIDVMTEIKLVENLDDLMRIDNATSLLDVNFVLDNNYNYQLLNESLNLSKKQVTLKKWAFAPSLSAYYQYSSLKYYSDESTMNTTPPNLLGVTLTVPVFSSFSRVKAVQEAQFGYQKQLNTFDNTRESLIIQHRQLVYNLSSAYESFETQKENIVVVQRVFDDISRKYEQGMAASLDVTNAGTDLTSAQSAYVQALLDVVNAQIDLENLLNIENN
jgi:outer membrane protein TolC